jgi:hypothetical protein
MISSVVFQSFDLEWDCFLLLRRPTNDRFTHPGPQSDIPWYVPTSYADGSSRDMPWHVPGHESVIMSLVVKKERNIPG